MKAKKTKKIKVIIIGNTGLCLECCKIIFDSPVYDLLLVVTDDLKIKKWCCQHQIKLLSYSEYQLSDYQQYVLLSIVNKRIISKVLIKKHHVTHAVNYHDSLLPAYAGVNSTTWAILNNEISHGVTWHKITDDIDEGDIIQQTTVSITPEDTAHSLNLKCTQQAIVLFRKLLVDLSNHTLDFKAQDLSKKTYYGLDYLPQNYGFINDCTSLGDIYRYCRALYFGDDYPNQITTAKIKLGNMIYLLCLPIFANAPQTENEVTGLYILSGEEALHFVTVKNIYGMKINLNSVIPIDELSTYKSVFDDNEWCALKAIKKHEDNHLNYTLMITHKANPIINNLASHGKSVTYNHCIEYQNLSIQQIISAVSLVLLRLAQQDEFFIQFYTNEVRLSSLAALVDSKCFIELSQEDLKLNLKDFESLIGKSLNKKHLLTKDFYYRYHAMNLLTDIGIYHDGQFTDQLTPHRLNFMIDDESITMISHDVDMLEISAISSALEVVISQYQQHLKQNTKSNNINLLSKEDYQKIVFDWNKTDKPYPKNKTIHQLFEEQAKRNPHNVAVVFEDKRLTYHQLNAKANQLARYLRSIITIEPDDLIVLCLDKSMEMIIGILSVLKSGAAYVPIDPSYPDERLKYILSDTHASLVLSQSHYLSRLGHISKATIVALDSNNDQDLPIFNLKPISSSNNLAYVIYTSGTTGQPKGVCILHKSLCNMTFAQQENLDINEESKILQFASISFDASVWEIFCSLSCGSQLHILPDKIKLNIGAIEKYIALNNIDIMASTPSVLLTMVPSNVRSLRSVISEGEACNNNILKKWKGVLINSYGTTENTICMTLHSFRKGELPNTIGKPLGNIKAYVVDSCLNNMPIGVIGELCISGIVLAQKYLNQPQLTSEKFIPNPFATEKDKVNGYNRLYKTGDLVRWLPNGNLEYIGRKDQQVKIRGFRIELSEIECHVIDIMGVQQAVVINRTVNGEQCLFAYYTANQQINPRSILVQLANKLPHYMLPSAALQINKIPLTTNGKIDKNALPDIIIQSSQDYIEPRTEQERVVCQAFSNILLIEKIGIDDDFFKLGGNSIKAIQLSMVLQSNLEIDVAEIFDLRTPRKLAHNKRITHDLLISKLQQIKHDHAKQSIKRDETLNSALLFKKEQYLAQIANMSTVRHASKPIQNVLLTGATGFLGCNLLNQLLTLTPYHIFLCVRAKDKPHAKERMADKYQFYFNCSLERSFGSRIVYIPCDLEKELIGLTDDSYRDLCEAVDSIIHCAALAKHYGIEQVFYNANVTSTINLLKLCELTGLKDFHYISTYSVMTGIHCDDGVILTEDDALNMQEEWNSPYNKTKYLGEINAIKWREKGINSSIYRVGNLAFMQQNSNVQEDVKDNAFASYVTFIRKLGYIADNMNEVEISPADITAIAIVKLFDKYSLSNQIYHVFNPNRIQLSKMLSTKNHKVRVTSFALFIDKLISYLQNNDDCALIGRFLLRMGWQADGKNSYINISNSANILQSKTESILNTVNFQWLTIGDKQLKLYVKQLDCVFNVDLTKAKYFNMKKRMISINKAVNAAKLKAIESLKSHKRAISIVVTIVFMAPLLYLLELLDVVTMLEFFDVNA